MPFFSIIVPFQNSQFTIKRCLNSLIHQKNFTNYEVILISDFSKDQTNMIVKNKIKFRENFFLIKTKKKTLGPGHARNIGIKKSSGKYIIFLDSDDVLSLNSLKNFYRILNKKKNIDILSSNLGLIDQLGNFKKKNFSKDLKFYKMNKINFVKNFFYQSVIPHVLGKVFKKKMIEKNNISFSSGYYEDINFLMKCAFFSKFKDTVNTKNYVKYNKVGSIVNTISKKHVIYALKSYFESYEFIKKKKIIAKKKLDHLIYMSLLGQVSVFNNKINNSGLSLKHKKEYGDLLKINFLKHSKKLKIKYKFSTKKDFLAKKFLNI